MPCDRYEGIRSLSSRAIRLPSPISGALSLIHAHSWCRISICRPVVSQSSCPFQKPFEKWPAGARVESSLAAAMSEDKGDSEVNGGIFIEGIGTATNTGLLGSTMSWHRAWL
jgi:hypothetical protein